MCRKEYVNIVCCDLDNYLLTNRNLVDNIPTALLYLVMFLVTELQLGDIVRLFYILRYYHRLLRFFCDQFCICY